MSDREEGHARHDQGHATKRKRTRACDQCRKRRVKCDGSETDLRPCSSCAAYKDTCVYTPVAEVRKRYVEEEYLKGLEAEVARLQLLVEKLQAELDAKTKFPVFSKSNAQVAISIGSQRDFTLANPPVKKEDPDDETFLEGFKVMTLNDTQRVRFMGRSSHFPLLKAAIKMKHDLVNDSDAPVTGLDDDAVATRRRDQFWLHIFDFLPPDPPYIGFPEPALMNELFDNYFRTIHVSFPLLHRPTFLQGVTAGQHLAEEGFGAVVLLVCALGARFSNNPATLLSGATTWQLAGWQWFDQVRERRKLMPLATTALCDLQVATLAAAYIATLALPHTNFSVVSHGLRLAQDLGAHRRMTYGATPTLEGEQRKRAFWCLIAMDRGMCTVLGRPCSIQDEDFDIDYPIECDDEYWLADDPRDAFKQPAGKPSIVSHFIWHLKLLRVNGRAIRTIYSLQSGKVLDDPESAQQVVAGLDSELNEWIDSLPEHLRYDPAREDLPFAAQAASLHATYHSLRIFIHRPFITRPCNAAIPFPSFAICTNAARSCIQVLERYFTLSGAVLVYQYHFGSLFQAGIIMLLRIWHSMRAGTVDSGAAEFAHVRTALRVLGALEGHWDAAGRFWDILHDLMTTLESRVDSGQHKYVNDTLEPGTDMTVLVDGHRPANHDALNPAQTAGGITPAYFVSSPDSQTFSVQAGIWQSAPALSRAPLVDVPQYATQTSDPDLDAIFADLLPTLPYDDSLAGLAQQFFVPGQHLDGGTSSAGQSYGTFVPGWT
ncbi:Zn(II)2Cys6 transcription factor [Phanerochaete sordida]|uniref:Zn(II)2Cys6 transcription factor n=1 Tax=Phanerochaete sordida TaxID=48140 RepID=A0A9P3G7M5_9APHY|nr:Zn(II)2Cys6 transcription factor [Phanerochaete sordida]